MRRSILSVLFAIALVALARPCRADYELKDGDTVVFLGDSITAARTYGKIVENYTLLRFPNRKVRFYNAGIGGDTAAAAIGRLDRDVFAHAPTVVTVCFGMNDVGWGLRADEEHVKAYLEALKKIVRECRKHKARVIYLTPAVTAADPAASEKDFLQTLADDGAKAVKSAGGETIDVQRGMRTIQKRIWTANAAVKDEKAKVTLHLADGVHLNDLGHLAMAFTILEGLGAPKQVSDVVLNAGLGHVVTEDGCRVSEVKASPERLEFTRLDEGLPINFGLFGALQFVWVPFHIAMNRYGLRVTGLAPGDWEVLADERPLGTYDAKVLAQGLDVASRTTSAWAPGGPWDAQASVLAKITDARHDLATALLLDTLWLPTGPVLVPRVTDVDRSDASLVDLQRVAARPRPYRFVVRRPPPPAPGPKPGTQPGTQPGTKPGTKPR